MATEQNLQSLTRAAGADLSEKQYRFVKQNSSAQALACSVAGESALGVLQNDPASGQAATVAFFGATKIVLGGTVAAGESVATDNAGRAVVAAGGNVVLGECLQGGAINEIGTILYQPKTASGTVVHVADNQTSSVTVTVSSAELLALYATPKELVAAPGAGYALVLDSATLFLDYTGTAYAGIAAGEDLTIKYTNAAGATLATVEATGFLDATADALRFVLPTTTAAFTPVANAALVLHMLTGEIITGNSPLKVQINYRVIPASF